MFSGSVWPLATKLQPTVAFDQRFKREGGCSDG